MEKKTITNIIVQKEKAVLWQQDSVCRRYQTAMMSFPRRRSWQPWGLSKQTDNTLYDSDQGFSHCHHNTLLFSAATCLCHDLSGSFASVCLSFFP